MADLPDDRNAGDFTYALYERVLHQSAPFPSLADVLYLAGCPLIGLSLIGITRTRTAGRDRVSWIDATIVASGFGLLSWVFLMAPTASSNDLPWFGRLVALAYPVWDVLFLSQTLLARSRVDGVAICAASTWLFLLVVLRIVGLVRQVEEQSEQLAALARGTG